MNLLVILAVFWPALSGLAIYLLPALREDRRLRGLCNCAALGVELALTIGMCFGCGTELVLLNLTPTLAVFFKVDTVGCLFAVLMSAMWLVGSVFALEYMEHDDPARERLYQMFYMTVLSALIGQCCAGSMITLYVFYELMTLLSVPMVVHERTPQAVAAGSKYLIYSIFGAMLGLLGIFVFQNELGTVNFVAGGVVNGTPSSLVLVITFLVILGFGTKAGMFPMHGWLPTAHPVAPAPASAVLSGVITKAGVLAIIRIIYFLIGAAALRGTWVQTTFMCLTLFTVFMGSMLAYCEPLMKKRLAYSTVSQVSYVLFGLSCLTADAFCGALLHVVGHSVIKNTLFLCAGAIIHQTGKTYVRDLRAIGKQMPIVIWCWTIASLGLIGIPPTMGFVSKWLLATGSLADGMGALSIVGPVVLIISALLTAAYLLPVTIHGFFPGSDFDYSTLEKKEPGLKMLVPLCLLAAGVVLTGIFAQPLMNAATQAAAALL